MIPIPGNPPSLLDPPTGCSFHPRCVHVHEGARRPVPDRASRAGPRSRGAVSHLKRCHLVDPEAIYETEVLPEIAPDLAEGRR